MLCTNTDERLVAIYYELQKRVLNDLIRMNDVVLTREDLLELLA